MHRKCPSIVACQLLMILVFLVLPGSPVALGREVITGSQSDVRVIIEGPWEHSTSAVTRSDAVDTLIFTQGAGNFIVSGGSRDVDHVLAALPTGSRTTDIDVSATYALRSVRYEGSTYGLFSVVVGDHVHTIIAPPDTFADLVENARANISVDDAAVFFGVDELLLARLLPSADGTDMPLIRLTAAGEAGSPVAATPIIGTHQRATPVAGNSGTGPGDTAGGDHEARWSGVRLSWTSDWQVGVEDGKLSISSSLEGYQYDEICLESARQVEGATVCLVVNRAGGIDNPESWRNRYSAPGALSPFGIPYFAVEITETSVIYADIDVQGEAASITQTDVVDGLRMTIRVSGPPHQLPELVEQAKSSVEVNGDNILERVDGQRLKAEIDAVMARLPTYQAERDTRMAALGLVDDHHFSSTLLRCDVKWTAPLELGDMGTLHPIDQGSSSFFSGEGVPTVEFRLVDTRTEIAGSVYCLHHVPSVDSWVLWKEARRGATSTDWEGNAYLRYVAVEGADVYYVLNREPYNRTQLYVLVKPLGGPAVVYTQSVPDGGLEALLASIEPGTLVINGVDVFQAMKDDELVSHLP